MNEDRVKKLLALALSADGHEGLAALSALQRQLRADGVHPTEARLVVGGSSAGGGLSQEALATWVAANSRLQQANLQLMREKQAALHEVNELRVEVYRLTGELQRAQRGAKAEAPRPSSSDELRRRLRGDTVGAMIEELLLRTEDPYWAIADRVRREFPSAKTTAASVASYASRLRRRGERVPKRRG